MTSPTDTLQRISALTPLEDIVSRLDAMVAPVAASPVAPELAVGATLAADVVAAADLPQRAVALHDGWAVAAEQTADAGSYAPVLLKPVPAWVNAGNPMPGSTDAVLPADAVRIENGNAEIAASATQGEGVLPAGFEITKGAVLRRAGGPVRPIDAEIFRTLAIKTISARVPRVKIISLSVNEDADFIAPQIANAVRAAGGAPVIDKNTAFEAAASATECDAIITIGGTGGGKNDSAVKSLARIGKLEIHGFGISPGQTAALGSVSGCVVLMLPGRLDAALAVFLAVGKRLMARLSGSIERENGSKIPLVKKITSTIGLAEVVFVRRVADGIEPLGTNVFSLQALMQADGWILIPPGSEGAPAGTIVEMRNLP